MKVFILVFASAVAGCMSLPHQHLSAPSSSASEAERIAAYERLFARGSLGTLLVNPAGAVVASSTDYLILGDGTRIAYVEDLAAVVPPDSPTGRAIGRYQRGNARSRPWGHAWEVSFAAGLIGGIAAPFVIDGTDGTRIGASLGIMFTGLGLGTVFALIAGSREGDLSGERISAFTTYDDDLRKGLDLCVDGTRVIACGESTTGTRSTESARSAASHP